MSWVTPNLDWSSNIEQNIENLILSNPIVQNYPNLRPVGKSYQPFLNELRVKAEEFYCFYSDNFYQEELEREITKQLIISHYKYKFKEVLNHPFTVNKGQFWWIPNYYILYKSYGGLKPAFFEAISDDGFYGFKYETHPCLVVEILENQLLKLVPFTSKGPRIDENHKYKVKVTTNDGEVLKYAIPSFSFLANYSMLKNNDDNKSLTISPEDFQYISQSV